MKMKMKLMLGDAAVPHPKFHPIHLLLSENGQRLDLDENPGRTTHQYTFEEFDALPISARGKTQWNNQLHES
jgi:hypothetical protein